MSENEKQWKCNFKLEIISKEGASLEDFNNSVKQRELSKKVFSGKEIVCVETPHGQKTPVEVSSEILKHLKNKMNVKIQVPAEASISMPY